MSRQPFIEKLTLQNFRSFRQATIQFANPTILVGKNGSGKSNLVDALDLLSDCMVRPLQSALDNRGGIEGVACRSYGSLREQLSPNFSIRVDFALPGTRIRRGHYSFAVQGEFVSTPVVTHEQCVLATLEGERVWFDRDQEGFRTNIAVAPALDRQALALPIIGGVEQLAPLVQALKAMHSYAMEPARIREMQDPDGGLALRRDGSNLASVIRTLSRQDRQFLSRLGEVLGSIVPGLTSLKPVRRGKRLTIEFFQSYAQNQSFQLEADEVSDGTLRVLGMLVAVMQQPAPSVILIEEPEASIHPGAIGAILDLIQIAAERSQVIITTHSPDLLDAEWLKSDQIRVVSWAEGSTSVAPLGEGAILALQQHLMGAGELFRANALDSEPASQPESGSLFDSALA
jgi:predicted ATPase